MNGDFSRRADALDVGQNLAASATAKKVWNLRSWWSGLSQVFGCLVILLTRSAKKDVTSVWRQRHMCQGTTSVDSIVALVFSSDCIQKGLQMC